MYFDSWIDKKQSHAKSYFYHLLDHLREISTSTTDLFNYFQNTIEVKALSRTGQDFIIFIQNVCSTFKLRIYLTQEENSKFVSLSKFRTNIFQNKYALIKTVGFESGIY